MFDMPIWAQVMLVAVAVALGFMLLRVVSHDKIEAILKKRRPGSMLATPAEFVEGPTHVEVALTLDAQQLRYENPDMQAYLDLKNLEEVEYDEDLMTGGHKVEGEVLRIRSHGHTFEFVISKTYVGQWKQKLPKHRLDDPGQIHAAGATT